MRNYRQALNAASDKGLHEPAILLANMMKNARKSKNIVWFSDMGGSGILTQAMQILVKNNMTLPDHTLFLHRPRTCKDTAYTLSQRLGMKLERDFTKNNNLNIHEVIGSGSLTLPFRRFKQEEDYNFFHLSADVVKGANGGQTAWKVGASLGAAAGAMVAAPAIATTVAAISTAVKVGGVALPLIWAHSPDTTDRIKSLWK